MLKFCFMVYDKDRSGLMEIEELHHFIKVCHLVLSYRVYEKCADFTFAKKIDEMSIVMASARGVSAMVISTRVAAVYSWYI